MRDVNSVEPTRSVKRTAAVCGWVPVLTGAGYPTLESGVRSLIGRAPRRSQLLTARRTDPDRVSHRRTPGGTPGAPRRGGPTPNGVPTRCCRRPAADRGPRRPHAGVVE